MNRDERVLDEAGKKHVVNIQRCVIIFLSLSLSFYLSFTKAKKKIFVYETEA